MKHFLNDLLQDLKPFLWYLLAGMAFTLLMWLTTGMRTPDGQGPGYWDDEDRAGQMVEQQHWEEVLTREEWEMEK